MTERSIMRWYWKLRDRLGRWIPNGMGVGLSSPQDEPMDCGELPLLLDVEGRKGTVYLSHGMWAALGQTAGWMTEEEALAIWEADVGRAAHDDTLEVPET